MTHPFEQAAEALEQEAELPRNRAYRNAYLLTAAHLRDQAAALTNGLLTDEWCNGMSAAYERGEVGGD